VLPSVVVVGALLVPVTAYLNRWSVASRGGLACRRR